MGTDERLPEDTGGMDGWCTVGQGAAAHQKSPETVRRWVREDAPAIRTRYVNGVAYINTGDLAAAADRRPEGSIAAHAACAGTGHRPAAPGTALEGWISMAEACKIARRSKTTIMRWAAEGDLGSVWCQCRRRRYIWAAGMPEAIARHR